MRKTKIICTIGPASSDPEIFRLLLGYGLNVARLNFSHGTHEEHGKVIDMIKSVREMESAAVGIMLDTKGPEIRTGKVQGGSVELAEGQEFILTTDEILGNNEICSITYQGLPQDVKRGDAILIDDGLIALKVLDVSGNKIKCFVENGGILGDNKGVNVPGVKVNLPAITEKDISDIIFGIEKGVDFIAASFIRKASDVREIRELLRANGGSHIKIISKIETREGVENIDEIIEVSDGIMVARGDLGVEIAAEEVPIVQKSIIKKCNEAGKIVITATQMLDSMIRNPRPTRAEVTDVANAIFDGTDAIMLSGETAAGKYPIESLKMMARIAARTEDAIDYEKLLREKRCYHSTVTDAISHATCTTAQDLGATAVITATKSGLTARMVSKYRPNAPIIAVTYDPVVMRQLSLVWGVYPVITKAVSSTDEMIEEAVKTALASGFVKEGDVVVITAGVPVDQSGTTNLIKVHVVER
ncbi:pyruvate kinase [Caldanaerobius fijiensis]|nr:pyruvate kinase [Caldanaerobius fijiensis]